MHTYRTGEKRIKPVARRLYQVWSGREIHSIAVHELRTYVRRR